MEPLPPSSRADRPSAAPAGQPPAHFYPRLLIGLALAALSIAGAFLLGRWLYPITGLGVTERSLLLILGCAVALVAMTFCFGIGRWGKIQQFAARYHSLHSWIGITTGSLLAMGFLAGTLTLFATPLQQWSLPAHPTCMTSPLPLRDVPSVQAVLDSQGFSSMAGPDLAGANIPLRYQLTLSTPAMAGISLIEGPELPLGLPAPRLLPSRQQTTGTPQTARLACLLVPSPVPSFIGGLHRRMGLPLPEPWAMPFVGLLCLFYGLALLSGVILLLPGIWRTLMTVRLVGQARRFWLDMHSLLGLCTLPFHLVIALTTALFAFSPFLSMVTDGLAGAPHQQIASQAGTRSGPLSKTTRQSSSVASEKIDTLLPPSQARTLLSRIAPNFRPLTLDYTNNTRTPTSQAERIALHAPLYDADDPSPLPQDHQPLLLATGTDLRGGALIGRDRGAAWLEPHTGQLLGSEDLPGRQTMIRQVLTWCLALHFGSFGGEFVRWLYIGLGLCGVGFFHTANQLWLNSHRRKMAGQQQTRNTTATLWASRLGEGCLLGCLLGLSALIALSPVMVKLHPLTGMRGVPLLSGPAMTGAITPGIITPAPVMLRGWHSVSLLYYALFGMSIIAFCLLPMRLCRSFILALSASCLSGAVILALLRHTVLLNTGTLSLTIALGLGGIGLWAGAISVIRQGPAEMQK